MGEGLIIDVIVLKNTFINDIMLAVSGFAIIKFKSNKLSTEAKSGFMPQI
jgi:hypothetical protein